MSWLDLYFLTRQMTTDWRIGGRTCFALSSLPSSTTNASTPQTLLIIWLALAASSAARLIARLRSFSTARP
jgi:hypothetical protein